MSMSYLAPLLAFDIGPIISFIVFVIVVLSSIIPQIIAKKKEQQGGPVRRSRQQPRPGEPMAGGQPGRPMAGGQPRKTKIESLGDEIEEFLRRAAQNAQGQQPPRPPQSSRPSAAGRSRSAQPRPAQPKPQQARTVRPKPPVPRRTQPPLEAEIVEPPRPPVGQGLRKKVAENINTVAIARHTRELGSQTRQATTKLTKNIHETFDHGLGSLTHKDVAVGQVAETSQQQLPMTSAAGLAALLTDTQSLKQAIVINEIIQRPTHRW